MNKMKTHSGAKKRIKVTSTGKLRREQAFTNHLLEKKSAKRKRKLGRETDISKADTRAIKRLLGR
jgi:large subunit ribosomal protein L35